MERNKFEQQERKTTSTTKQWMNTISEIRPHKNENIFQGIFLLLDRFLYCAGSIVLRIERNNSYKCITRTIKTIECEEIFVGKFETDEFLVEFYKDEKYNSEIYRRKILQLV